MFKSNIRELMGKKKKTVRGIAEETGISSQTVFRATQDDTIGSCQLNTLAKIGDSLGVRTKRLYDEMPDADGEE